MSIELKTKANVVIGIALAALAGLGWLSLRENRNLTEGDRWVSHTRDVLDASASLRSHLSDAGIARRIFLQGDRKQIDVFRAAEGASIADFNRLRSLTADKEEQQKRLDRLEPLARARLAAMKKSIAIHLETANDQSVQQDLTDQLTTEAAEFAEQAREFERIEKELLIERSDRAEANVRNTSEIDGILSFAVFCFIILATAILNHELSRRKQAEEEIAKQKSLLQLILDTCNDAIVVADSEARIILRNPAAIQMCGDTLDRVSEEAPQRLGYYQPDEKTLFAFRDLPLWRAVNGDQVDNVEICVQPPNQPNTRWTLASSRPLLNKGAKSFGGVVFYRDITDRKELENKLTKYANELKCSNMELQKAQVALQRLATADELTGLHNRRGFLALAEQSLGLARRAEKSFALVFADLDGLKKINDTLGHAEGDQAIGDAAFVLRDSFRHCDVLGRLGGDEFAVLMVDASEESTEIVRKRIAEKVEKLNSGDVRPYRLSLSIGILQCAFDEELSLEALLEKADALMYAEKSRKGAGRRPEGRRDYSNQLSMLEIVQSLQKESQVYLKHPHP
jgi:diguanylate cyclase (GGDEF)-like protein/PAS domain S-box-containing protein